MTKTRMNTERSCYSDFFGTTTSLSEFRIRNDEVVGSIPTSSTILTVSKQRFALAPFRKSYLRRTSPGLASSNIEIPIAR
jgi:hypothetical protein